MFTWNYYGNNIDGQVGEGLLLSITTPPQSWSPTEIVFADGKGAKFVLTGNFDPNGAYPPVAGQITGLKAYAGNSLMLEATGYDINLLHWNLAVLEAKTSGDGGPLMQLLMGDSLVVQGSNESNLMFGGFVSAQVYARGGDDQVMGTPGKDLILLGGGDDWAVGQDGKDIIEGGKGNDWMMGWNGKDKLTGGAGVDTFAFAGDLDSIHADKITDFRPGKDMIGLELGYFSNVGPEGELKAKYFHVGADPKNGNDRVIYDDKTSVLSYDQDGSGNQYAEIKLAKLKGAPDLGHDDIMIFA